MTEITTKLTFVSHCLQMLKNNTKLPCSVLRELDIAHTFLEECIKEQQPVADVYTKLAELETSLDELQSAFHDVVSAIDDIRDHIQK